MATTLIFSNNPLSALIPKLLKISGNNEMITVIAKPLTKIIPPRMNPVINFSREKLSLIALKL